MSDVARPPTLLVVEDDDDIRVSVAELFEDEGYRVVQSRNGREAEDYLQANPAPACILLDLWMPVMDGWAFAAALKRGDRPEIPTVVITAAEPHWGYPAPAPHVVRKPLDTRRLVALVKSLTAGRALRD